MNLPLFHHAIQQTNSAGDETIIALDIQGHNIYSVFFYKIACCSLAPYAADHSMNGLLVVGTQQVKKLINNTAARGMLHDMENFDLVHAGR